MIATFPRAERPEPRSAPDVESFYHLHDSPLHGRCCNGTACFVARHLNPERWTAAERQPGRVYCLGRCFAGPATADENPRPRVEVRSREAVVLQRVIAGGARTLGQYTAASGYHALEKALTLAPGQVVEMVERSGLRGRGGAAFPTGRKWRTVLAQPAHPRHVVANADEGDAGAYIDRFLIEDDPYSLLEGMTIAAYAVGASRGWIYLRSEYPLALSILRAAVKEARAAGYLGERILGRPFDFDLEIRVGRGSYLCGEETALIRSLEGRRPEAMARPPYPTEHGLFGGPTLVNNVETLVSVPWIISRGAEDYRALGFSKSRGTKVVSLNSLFNRPGLYEIEFGVTLRSIVEELGGGLRGDGALQGVLVGGPLAGVVPPGLLDTRFGFEELRQIGASVGHGGIIAFDHHTSIPELLHHVFSFGAFESCGKCVPCRLGSRRLEQLFATILQPDQTHRIDRTECEHLVAALKLSSLCGFGVGLGEFAESALRFYGKELQPCWR